MSEIKRTSSEFNRLAVRAVRILEELDDTSAVWREDPEFATDTQADISSRLGLSNRLKVFEPGKTAGRDPYNSIGLRARPRSS